MNRTLKLFTPFNSQRSSNTFKNFKKISIKQFQYLDLNDVFNDTDKNKTFLKTIFYKYNTTKTYENLSQKHISNHFSKAQIPEFLFNQIGSDSLMCFNQQASESGSKIHERLSTKIPWLPKKLSDIDLIGKTLYEDKVPQNQSHPQFTDPVYRKRRDQIANIAQNYKIQEQIPTIDYTKDQNNLWVHIIKNLLPLHQKYFCEQFLLQFNQLNRHFKIEQKIPQLQELSKYLQQKTGFRIKPVHGIVSQREFLNALAFRVFLSTQYLRHPCTPQYTPEPDIVHEIVGHIPMFADKEIAVIFVDKEGNFTKDWGVFTWSIR